MIIDDTLSCAHLSQIKQQTEGEEIKTYKLSVFLPEIFIVRYILKDIKTETASDACEVIHFEKIKQLAWKQKLASETVKTVLEVKIGTLCVDNLLLMNGRILISVTVC